MSPSVSVRLLLTQSDERLVGYARAGHERAFEALVERYRRQLHRYCRRLLLSDERAEDALQQALLQAWVALRGGAEVHDVRPWLYRIVHNAAVNALRVSGYDYCTLNESLSGADAPQADLDRRIAVREALAGLAALPEMQREALLRTAVEGRSHQQVASDLGVSEPALRGLVYRARTALRAAASAIVPPPLLSWALDAGTRSTPVLERVAGLGGGAAGLAGMLAKGSAVAVTAGALAGGIVAAHTHSHKSHARPLARPSAQTSSSEGAASRASSAAGVSVRPAAFTQPSGGQRGVTHSGDVRRPTNSTGHPGHDRLPRRPHRFSSPAPTPAWSQPTGHDHGDGSGQDGQGHRSASGAGNGGGSGGSSSHERRGDRSGGSGAGPGDREQRDGGGSASGGTGQGGGGSGRTGKDGSGDQTGGGSSGQASAGGGESGSRDSRLSEHDASGGSSQSAGGDPSQAGGESSSPSEAPPKQD